MLMTEKKVFISGSLWGFLSYLVIIGIAGVSQEV